MYENVLALLVQEKRVHLSVLNEMEVKHLSNITKLNNDEILMFSCNN